MNYKIEHSDKYLYYARIVKTTEEPKSIMVGDKLCHNSNEVFTSLTAAKDSLIRQLQSDRDMYNNAINNLRNLKVEDIEN